MLPSSDLSGVALPNIHRTGPPGIRTRYSQDHAVRCSAESSMDATTLSKSSGTMTLAMGAKSSRTSSGEQPKMPRMASVVNGTQ